MRLFALLGLSILLALPASAQNFPFPIPGGRDLSIQLPGGGNLGNLPVQLPGQRSSRFGDRDQMIQIIGTVAGVLMERHQRNRAPQNYPNYPQPQTYPDPYPRTPNYPAPSSTGRPADYDVITASNGLPARLDPSSLPLKIYSNNPAYHTAFAEGITLWNGAGIGPVFAVSSERNADLIVDWSGRGVAAGARAETRMMTRNGQFIPTQITVRPSNLSMGDLSQVMTHELGHVLGLDHSDNRNDVMYRSEQRRGVAQLSQRDRQMLHWLYSQERYAPMVAGGGAQGFLSRGLADANVTCRSCR